MILSNNRRLAIMRNFFEISTDKVNYLFVYLIQHFFFKDGHLIFLLVKSHVSVVVLEMSLLSSIKNESSN